MEMLVCLLMRNNNFCESLWKNKVLNAFLFYRFRIGRSEMWFNFASRCCISLIVLSTTSVVVYPWNIEICAILHRVSLRLITLGKDNSSLSRERKELMLFIFFSSRLRQPALIACIYQFIPARKFYERNCWLLSDMEVRGSPFLSWKLSFCQLLKDLT